jgi:hypothetical protein
MSEHPGAQAAAPARKHAETDPVDRNQQHQFPTLIPVAKAEQNGLEDDSAHERTGERGKLTLQISAKNDFLAEARGKRHQDPKNHFEPSLRHHVRHGLRGFRVEQIGDCLQERETEDEEKCDTQAEVSQEIHRTSVSEQELTQKAAKDTKVNRLEGSRLFNLVFRPSAHWKEYARSLGTC